MLNAKGFKELATVGNSKRESVLWEEQALKDYSSVGLFLGHLS